MRAKSVREGAGTSARGRRAEHECRRGAPVHFLDRGGAQDTPPETPLKRRSHDSPPAAVYQMAGGVGPKKEKRVLITLGVGCPQEASARARNGPRLLLMDNP